MSTFFARDEWKSNGVSQFSSRRKSFNFDALMFSDEFSAAETRSTGMSTTRSTGKDSDYTRDGSMHQLSSMELTDHLDMPASQKLVVKSRTSNAAFKERRSRQQSLRNLSSSLAFDMIPMAGRSDEVQKLTYAYEKRETIRLALIAGDSGSGKTMLAKHLRERVMEDSGIFCLGKFDVHNRADPYHAIVEAMDDLFQHIRNDTGVLSAVKDDINANFADEDYLLLKELLPSFSRIAKRKRRTKEEKQREKMKKRSPTALDDRGITDRSRRIQHVFVKFLRLVAKPDRPLVICLDDIQWIGTSCLSLINTIMTAENLDNLFLLSTCRAEYLDAGYNGRESGAIGVRSSEDSAILLDFLSKYSKSVHRLKLRPLDEVAVRQIVNSLIRLPEDDTTTQKVSRIICRKTGGNPYFVLEFMRMLNDEELLMFEESSCEWIWMHAEIETLDVSSNVAQTVQKRFLKMPSEDLFVAQVASCISKTVDPALLDFVMDGLKEDFESQWPDVIWPSEGVEKHLEALQMLGVLETNINGRCYDFVHDQLQHASFKLIPQERVDPMTRAIGKRMISGMNETGHDRLLFTAVELCGSAIDEMNEVDKGEFAFWAFLAGDTALQQGASEYALKFLQMSIQCLGDEAFQRDPELALPLFSGAAEAAYCLNKCDAALEYIKLVKSQTSIPEIKKSRVCIAEMKVFNSLAQRKNGLVAFSNFVNSVKAFKLPTTRPGVPAVIYQIVKTINFLKKYGAEKLLALPESEDPALAVSLTAFAESLGALFLAGPNLFVVSTCKAMRCIVKHGVTTHAPLIFACFGTVVAGMGNRKRGLELGEVALELCDIHNFSEALPMSVQMVFGFVRFWLKPMGEFEAPVRYTLECATKNGQVELVIANFYLHVAMYIETQKGTLQDIIKEYETFYPKYADFKGGKGGIQANMQFAYKLAYPSRDSTSLNGDIMNEEEAIEFAKEFREDFIPYMIDYFKLQLTMYLGDPIQACKYAKNTLPLGASVMPSSHYAMRGHFAVGVVNSMAYELTRRTKHLTTLRKMHKKMHAWQKEGNPNVGHFVHFLDAEYARVKGNDGEARVAYTKSLVISRRLGFRLDAAFTNERLFSLRAGQDDDEAREFLVEAINLYSDYGARTKVVQLKDKFRSVLRE